MREAEVEQRAKAQLFVLAVDDAAERLRGAVCVESAATSDVPKLYSVSGFLSPAVIASRKSDADRAYWPRVIGADRLLRPRDSRASIQRRAASTHRAAAAVCAAAGRLTPPAATLDQHRVEQQKEAMPGTGTTDTAASSSRRRRLARACVRSVASADLMRAALSVAPASMNVPPAASAAALRNSG